MTDHSRGAHLPQPETLEIAYRGRLPVAPEGLRPSLADVRAALSAPAEPTVPAVLPPDPKSLPPAGLLAIVSESGEGLAQLHMAVRPSTMRDYPGEVVLPGGKWAPGDATLRDTALREANEEVGLAPDAVTILGSLPVASAIGGRPFDLHAFVGEISAETELFPSGEAPRIVVVTLAELLADGAYQQERWPNAPLVHVFTLGDRSIYGGTAQILVSLLAGLR